MKKNHISNFAHYKKNRNFHTAMQHKWVFECMALIRCVSILPVSVVGSAFLCVHRQFRFILCLFSRILCFYFLPAAREIFANKNGNVEFNGITLHRCHQALLCLLSFSAHKINRLLLISFV